MPVFRFAEMFYRDGGLSRMQNEPIFGSKIEYISLHLFAIYPVVAKHFVGRKRLTPIKYSGSSDL